MNACRVLSEQLLLQSKVARTRRNWLSFSLSSRFTRNGSLRLLLRLLRLLRLMCGRDFPLSITTKTRRRRRRNGAIVSFSGFFVESGCRRRPTFPIKAWRERSAVSLSETVSLISPSVMVVATFSRRSGRSSVSQRRRNVSSAWGRRRRRERP